MIRKGEAMSIPAPRRRSVEGQGHCIDSRDRA